MLYDFALDELFQTQDLDAFVKEEIENKAIIVIDELDKIVRTGEGVSKSKASDEGV